jgi:hypothetical protein
MKKNDGGDVKLDEIKRLDTHMSFSNYVNDDFEVPHNLVHRGSYDNFLV